MYATTFFCTCNSVQSIQNLVIKSKFHREIHESIIRMCYTNLQLSNCSSTVKKNQRATLSVPQISYQNVWSCRARRSGGPRHLGRARGCRRESYCNARVKQTTAGAVGGCAAAAVSMLRGLRQSAQLRPAEGSLVRMQG